MGLGTRLLRFSAAESQVGYEVRFKLTVHEPRANVADSFRTRRPNYEFLHPVDEYSGTLDGAENAGIPGLGVDLQRDSDVQDPESDEIRVAGAEAAQTVPQRASREARTVLAKGTGLPQGDGVEISAYRPVNVHPFPPPLIVFYS